VTVPFGLGLQAPLWLLALLAAPRLVWLYVRHEQGARRGRAAFAAPALLPSVAPRLPGWRRHLPVLMYLLALIALVIALARPQVTIAVPIDQARVLLVFDQSGSMASTDVQPTRLDAARRAAGAFLTRLPRRVQAGAVVYNQAARVIQGPTRSRAAVRSALAAVKPAGSTATGDALNLALSVARRAAKPGAKPPPAAIVLLSDGKSVRGSDPVAAARAARRARVPIYTVSLGTPQGTIPRHDRQGNVIGQTRVPPDPQTLSHIAQTSGGRTFDVRDSARLSAVYQRLGSQIARKKEPRQITAGFAGGALALVVAGGLMSLFWFGRIP
jgi:Ca-activated chloride channel family protein